MSIITIDHPQEFKEGVRILMRTLRSKEGGKLTGPDRVAEKLISKNAEEFDKCFAELMSRRVGQERIYSTVEARSLDKAIRIFKYRQLDAEYFDKESRDSFYVDIYNRWISALQNPGARSETYFMVDVDDGKDDYNKIQVEILKNNITLVHDYFTKNGRHVILKPFNPALVTFDVQKNGMMLWVYNEEHEQ